MIKLLEDINGIGVKGATPTLNPAMEAIQVSANRATYITPPNIGDAGVPVLATKGVTGRIGISAGSGSGAFLFGGVASSNIAGNSEVLATPPVILPVGFTITANTGVTGLTVAIQGSTDAAQSNWVTLGVVSLPTPGTASFNSMLPYSGYRASIISIAGGSCSIVAGGAVVQTSSAVTSPINTGLPASGPQIIGQSAIPIVQPSSFTMGNNGAFSGVTALYATYSYGAWIALQAGAIYAGSPAGVYWSAWSSTSAGTVYQETLPLGATPYIPSTQTPFVCTGPGAVTITANTNVYLAAIKIPAGIMGPNGVLRISALGASDGNSAALNGFIGGSLGNGSQNFFGGSVGAMGGQQRTIRNRGVANRQICVRSDTFAETGQVGAVAQLLTIDTSVDQWLQLAMFPTAVGVTSWLEGYTIEVLPA